MDLHRNDDDQTEEDQTMVNQWISFGSRVAIRIALHPFEYAKVLIQVSYYLPYSPSGRP